MAEGLRTNSPSLARLAAAAQSEDLELLCLGIMQNLQSAQHLVLVYALIADNLPFRDGTRPKDCRLESRGDVCQILRLGLRDSAG